MQSIKKIALGVGLIVFVAWLGIFLKLESSSAEKSLLVAVFTSKSFVNFIIVFNCVGCVVWMCCVVKTTLKNRDVFLVPSLLWLCINLIFFLVFGFNLCFSSRSKDLLLEFPYVFAVTAYAMVLYAILVTITYSVYKSSEDDDLGSPKSCSPDLGNPYRPEMYMKTPNRIHLNSNADNRNCMVDDGNFMRDDELWQEDDIYTISISNDSESYTDAQDHGRNGFSMADQTHNYDSHWTTSDHGQDPNAGPPHHSHSHQTHCTSSHSIHDDTHTSLYETNTATDYASCDSGGGDASNCDSGGCGGNNGDGNDGGGDD